MTDRTPPPPGAAGARVHRLLDQVFEGVLMTPDAQDLKEEVRTNLLARAAELEAAGASASDAARRAVDELGDLRDLLVETRATPGTDVPTGLPSTGSPSTGSATTESPASAHRRHRVRPRPAFILRTVLLALVAAAALVLVVLVATGVVAAGLGALLGLGVAVAVTLGAVTADALLQETTTNHPLPARRAAGFGAAVFGTFAGLSLVTAFVLHREATWAVIVAAVVLVSTVAAFSWLGATQTNRHKAWVRQAASSEPPNRFEREPETAARFGIYSVVIWTLTLALAVWLGLTVTWWWAAAAFVAGFAVMMLTLARMMFGPRRHP